MSHHKHEQMPTMNEWTDRVQTRPAVPVQRRQERQVNAELIEQGASGFSQIGTHVCKFVPR